MTDLRTRLERIAGPLEPPDSTQIGADLTRGRRALRRRRLLRTAVSSALGVTVAAAALAVVGTGGGAPPPSPPTHATVRSGVALVAYRGLQPKGFTIDTVPEGWYIQADEDNQLVLAPGWASHPAPYVDPSKEPVYDPTNLSDKISVLLQISRPHGPTLPGIPVRIRDRDAVLVKQESVVDDNGQLPPPGGDTGWSIWVKQPFDAWLRINFWQGLGFTKDQMVQIASGVHVTSRAQGSR